MNKTQAEIHDQYRALAKTIAHIGQMREQILEFYQKARPARILYIGCGSSYSIGCSAAMSARRLLGLEANCVPGGDLMLRAERYAPLLSDALLIPLSRSGETHEILRAVEAARRQERVKALAVTCAAGSALSNSADMSVDMPWAFDESVCQTRSVTNLYGAAQMISSVLSHTPEIENELKAIADNGDDYLQRIEPAMLSLSKMDFKNCFVLSDGETCGVAEEAALAMTEIAYTVSQHKHVLDVRHGPILLVRPDSFVLIRLTQEGGELERALVKDIAGKGASVVTYSDMPMSKPDGAAVHLSFGTSLSDATSAIPLLLPMQLLSYHTAVRTGHDPDQPEGLSAWISLT